MIAAAVPALLLLRSGDVALPRPKEEEEWE
jgi:hypothetical protein